MTIDGLAAATGTTTRRIRSLQTLGLLPHPTLHGRTGRYDSAHRDRLMAILHLQEQGFSLESLGLLFDALDAGRSLASVLGLAEATLSADSADNRDRLGRALRLRRTATRRLGHTAWLAAALGGPHHVVGRERGLVRPTGASPGRRRVAASVGSRTVPDAPAVPLLHWEQAPEHGAAVAVTTRHGGTSAAPYDTLNLGLHVGDDPASVVGNRARAAAAFGVALDDVGLRPPGPRRRLRARRAR